MDLKQLIAASHGPQTANAWANFAPSNVQLETATRAGRDLLQHFPTVPGACVMMSTLLACQLEKLGLPSGYVVAGSLYVVGSRFVGDTRVFGEAARLDGKARFSASDPSWDGHAWVVFGGTLLDPSIFRTAYSRCSPPALATHVKKEFGEGRGMLICSFGKTMESGLRYEPEYVLTQEQVAGNARGAVAKAKELLGL